MRFRGGSPPIRANGWYRSYVNAFIQHALHPTSIQRVKEVIIYTDGACSGNPGPGGWAALLQHNGHEKTIAGGEPLTTNNRMELTAVIEALRALKEPCKVVIHTDSAYVHNAFTAGWLEKWQRNGWKTSSRKPVENQDLWRELLDLSRRHRVK